MARQLVECVPNFSEGRDAAKMDAIVQTIVSVPEVVLLDRVLTNDPGIGVVRHVDAGYPEAQEFAQAQGLRIPMKKN